MSDSANKEIIDELTSDLEASCISENVENKAVDEAVNGMDEQEEETESENKKKTIPDDYIDEAELELSQANLSEDEKENLRKQCIELKNKGNVEFKNGELLESLDTYTQALRLCPVSSKNERSILYSNRAASKIKLNRNESAIDDCTKAIELDPNFVRPYLRRAKLYKDADKLEDSLEDYKKILELDPGIGEARQACLELPPIIQEKNEKLKEEMMGKLKDLGNMILRPFGLSTDNFKMQQDPNSGGYSVQFSQNK